MKYFIFITTAITLLFQQALACEGHNTSVVAITKQKDDLRKTEGSLTCLEMQECIKGCLKEAEKIEETPETNTTVVVNISKCGEGEWSRIAHLNMSDSSQSCPPEWNEYTTPVRSCGRKDITLGTRCDSISYTTDGYHYNKVCGRALGYRYGYTNAFHAPPVNSVDEIYVEGLSITHGTNPRHHIWTFASGNCGDANYCLGSCPCIGGGNGFAAPSFVGNNYHCESSGPPHSGVVFLTGDVLWDGIRCEGGCCNKSPPWFSVTLQSTTSDDVEVRMCGFDNNEDTPIKLLEIYVQ